VIGDFSRTFGIKRVTNLKGKIMVKTNAEELHIMVGELLQVESGLSRDNITFLDDMKDAESFSPAQEKYVVDLWNSFI